MTHPPYIWLIGLLRGKLNPRKRRAVIGHLLVGCESCREVIASTAKVMFRPALAEPIPGGPEYDLAVDRAVRYAVKRKQQRRQEQIKAEANVSRLLSEGYQAVAEERGIWTWELCELLLERIAEFRYEDAREMRRIASLVCEATERLDPDFHGKAATIDMKARAWGEHASACRHSDSLSQAEWSLQRALELRRQGSGSPLLHARLTEIAAGIMTHRRHFQPAFQALDLSFSIYVRQGQMKDALRVLIGRGIHTGRSGDAETALLMLARALAFAAENRIDDPKLAFVTLHNILLFRVECGEFLEANRQLFEMRPLYVCHAGAVDSLKMRWIEARIAAGLADDERAEKGFLKVREEFNARGQVYHAAVAGLELAAVWFRQGRLPEVRRLVAEIVEIFRSREVARETIAALLMLREALKRDGATRELILKVAALLKAHEHEAQA